MSGNWPESKDMKIKGGEGTEHRKIPDTGEVILQSGKQLELGDKECGLRAKTS